MIVCWAMVDSSWFIVELSWYLSYPRGVHNIGLLVKTAYGLRALMKSALPRLITTAASRALYLHRLGGSRSDLSCHQLDPTSHGAEGLLDLSIKSKRCSNTCQRPVCSNSHTCLFPLARGWLIVLVARQQRPDNPRILVRHRHGRTVVAAALKELPHPQIGRAHV